MWHLRNAEYVQEYFQHSDELFHSNQWMEYSSKNAAKSIPDYISMPFCIRKQRRNEQVVAVISENKVIDNLFLWIWDAKYTEQL